MNKKRFLAFITVLLLSISAFIVWVAVDRRPVESGIAVESSGEGLRFFYYRSVPGLKRAEESDLVVPIHKAYRIPEKPYELKIDRIWFSKKSIYVLYHVENIDKIAYLGGNFYFEGQNPDELPKFDPQESIGRSSEKGVIYNGGFYSCAVFPALDDMEGDAAEIYFKPFLHVEDVEYSFDALALQREQLAKEEPEESFELDGSLQIGDNLIQFHEIISGISQSRIRFSYNGPDSEIVYGLQGTIQTDKGEKIEINSMPQSIPENPGHYYLVIPPFDTLPSSLNFNLKSIDIIGNDGFTCEIDVNSAKKTKGSIMLQQEIEQIRNTKVEIEQLIPEDNFVSVVIAYNDAMELKPPYNRLKTELPILERQVLLLANTQNIYNPLPNVVSIRNNYNKAPDSESSDTGMNVMVARPAENKLSIAVPRDFWDESDRIYIEINNLTYRNVLDQWIKMELLR